MCSENMMTSSNGNIFRVTGPLCGEFTGPGEFPTQRPVTRSFDVFFDLRLNKRLSKQPWGWWFETSSWSLWRQCNENNVPRQCWKITGLILSDKLISCAEIRFSLHSLIELQYKRPYHKFGTFITCGYYTYSGEKQRQYEMNDIWLFQILPW